MDGLGLAGVPGVGGANAGASSPNGGPSLSGFGGGVGNGGCDSGGEVFPVVIHCVAEEGEEPRQSHVLLAGKPSMGFLSFVYIYIYIYNWLFFVYSLVMYLCLEISMSLCYCSC